MKLIPRAARCAHPLSPNGKPGQQLSAIAICIGAAMAAWSGAARADDLNDLKAQVDVLLKKVADLERQTAAPNAAVLPGAVAVTAGATKGSFKLPGSDTSVTIGGYVKLDAIYSSKSAGVGSSADQELEPASIPVGPGAGANERGQIKLHARQSRLFFKTSAPSSHGEIGTYLEFDLFGAAGNESVSNSHGLRVRHAYGSIGHLLAGQTWTTFSDPAAYAETLDFGGPAGKIFVRQAQLRWTDTFANGSWSAALENPETVAVLADGTAFRADDDRFPDLAANVHFDTAAGKFSAAALLRQVRVDSAASPDSRDRKWGGGVGVNGVVPVRGTDDVRFSLYYGSALGRYTNGVLSDATLTSAGRVELSNQWIAAAAYRHFWSPTLRSTLALSGLQSRNPQDANGSVNRSSQSAHLNLIWSPVAQANLGIEYLHARRQTENRFEGKLDRLQTSAQFLF